MRCSTCGENLRPGEDRCPTCGAVVPTRSVPTRRTGDVRECARCGYPEASCRCRRPSASRGVRECIRCGYRGDGIPYFRRPLHAALLVGVSFPTFGVGGLIYYAAFRRNLVCPECGAGWEIAFETTGLESPERRSAAVARRPASGAVAGPLPPSGIGRRIFGIGLGAIGIMTIISGVADGFIQDLVLTGAMFGMVGSGTFLWGWRALQRRRRAVLQALGRKVLALADARGGVLTVTEVAAELDLSLEAAEKLMVGMDDGFRVRSDISDEGVIYYEFPELRHRKRLRTGKPA